MADDTSNTGWTGEPPDESSAEEDGGATDGGGPEHPEENGADPEASPNASREDPGGQGDIDHEATDHEATDYDAADHDAASAADGDTVSSSPDEPAGSDDPPPEAPDDHPPYGKPFSNWLLTTERSEGPQFSFQSAVGDGPPRDIWLIKMATDYMEPQIIMGDTVAVEVVSDLVMPDTYFFGLGDTHQVARLEDNPDDTVQIVPANEFYSPMTVDPKEVQLQIYGRVWGRVHRV